ncbi:MAG TPA: signal peptidase I [Terriglobales bacterium]|nr:signal peptidase I [Terriglobales bacterium]
MSTHLHPSGAIGLVPLRVSAREADAVVRVPAKPRRHIVLKKILLIAFALLFIRTFLGEAALVPTSSMEGTILVGDHILMNKLLYGPQIPFTSIRMPFFKTIQRREIIAFHYPRDPNLVFLKRVAAVGGDRVEIRDDVLYVNDVPVREDYARYDKRPWRRHPENMRVRSVPQGHLFVLGDNRDNSDDSRYWGTVPAKNVIGEPMVVYWSYDAPSSSWLEKNPGRMLEFYGSIVPNLFARTRWSRTGFLL